MKKLNKIVVKLGTEALIGEKGDLDYRIFLELADQIGKLADQGIQIALVTSGSIKAGKERMKAPGFGPVNLKKKYWAGVGARHLLNQWGDAFESSGMEVGQIWVTYANWRDEREHESIKQAVFWYFNNRIVPVINENDVVSDQEVVSMDQGLSENDRLARMVACLIEADGVLFLTKLGGVFNGDPGSNAEAKMYEVVGVDIASKLAQPQGTSTHGTGGISAKITEALICSEKGMAVAIAGVTDDVIIKFAHGERVGTKVKALLSA